MAFTMVWARHVPLQNSLKEHLVTLAYKYSTSEILQALSAIGFYHRRHWVKIMTFAWHAHMGGGGGGWGVGGLSQADSFIRKLEEKKNNKEKFCCSNLLGTSLLAHYQLLVDVANSCLINFLSFKTTPLKTSTVSREIISITTSPKFQHFQEEYQVFCLELHQFHHTPPKPGIYCYMKTMASLYILTFDIFPWRS